MITPFEIIFCTIDVFALHNFIIIEKYYHYIPT